jgi:hypothetical protein
VPRPRVPNVPIRTWDDALAEYLEEMYAAIG